MVDGQERDGGTGGPDGGRWAAGARFAGAGGRLEPAWRPTRQDHLAAIAVHVVGPRPCGGR